MIKNPNGLSIWSGKWSPDSAEWTEQAKAQIQHDIADLADGIFWMELEDVKRYFKKVEISHISD